MASSPDKLTRIAIVDSDRCKPKKCRQECKRSCPVVRMGKLCIEVAPTSKIAWISEELCIGCGICVKKCPFEAIQIINLPKNLEKDTTHRYGPNSFKLHRLPMPRPGQVLGLVGTNGIGKSTALMILAGKLKPNLGKFDHPPDWQEILVYFRGSELQNFFTKLLEDNIKAIIKPQYVDSIPRSVKGNVLEIILRKDDRKVHQEVNDRLELGSVLNRDIANLSGGELQRFAIAVTCVQAADMYMFDEPSSYLDVRQRLRAAQAIRDLCDDDKYVIAVEHDLSVLDYLSDFVCCFGEDTRVLTDRGYLFIDQLERLVQDGVAVQYACYDQATRTMRYAPGTLRFPPNVDGKLISFASPAEQRRWTDGCDEYGSPLEKCASDGDGIERGNHLSLRVTAEHDVFAQVGSTLPGRRGVVWPRRYVDGKREFVPPTEGAGKRRAAEYAAMSGKALRMVACVEAGFAPAPQDSQAQRESVRFREWLSAGLGITTAEQTDAFLSLYGFWLGDGSLSYPSLSDSCDVHGSIIFQQHNELDIDWLKHQLDIVGVRYAVSKLDGGGVTLSIDDQRWFDCFDAEYGRLYTASKFHFPAALPEHVQPVTFFLVPVEEPNIQSAKWYWMWVYKRSKAHCRLILDGLCRATGCSSGDEATIPTSSLSFREATVQLCYHAGFSAYFDLAYRAGAPRRTRRGKDTIAHADVWEVHYTDTAMEADGVEDAWPSLRVDDGVKEVPYAGRIWCVTVNHNDHLIIAQRALRDGRGRVTKAGRGVIVGQCLYGKPGAYGVVTAPFGVREGINIFLAGFVPTENLRFRQAELSFKVAENVQNQAEEEQKRHTTVNYPAMTKVLGDFKLTVQPGGFAESEIIVMLGQNGTGKTTFIKMLAGLLAPDEGGKVPPLNVSYKPQKIAPKFEGTVRQLMHQKIRQMYQHPQFNADVMRPLNIEDIIDQEVKNLSGGELQRVALTLALGKPADIYLIDEPSAYLDSEQRIHAAKVIKRYILHAKKTAFIVEHDFIMATYLADRVIVYDGVPARDATANSPQPLLTGMNAFLKDLQITFRRDPSNHRPRINKMNSVKDKGQKLAGTFFYLGGDDDDDADVPESRAEKKKREKRLVEEQKETKREEARAAEKAKNRADEPDED